MGTPDALFHVTDLHTCTRVHAGMVEVLSKDWSKLFGDNSTISELRGIYYCYCCVSWLQYTLASLNAAQVDETVSE